MIRQLQREHEIEIVHVKVGVIHFEFGFLFCIGGGEHFATHFLNLDDGGARTGAIVYDLISPYEGVEGFRLHSVKVIFSYD
jgi:hypothetical protein